MRCPRCNAFNSKRAGFCPACGARLGLACRECGASAPADSVFCSQCGAALQPAAAVKSSSSGTVPDRKRAKGRPSRAPSKGKPKAAKGSAPEGERRHLTVLFADLVDSTPLSTQVDPEELRDVVRAYQELCGKMVGRFDGTVAHYLGDGVVAYFGYPAAHEDDAQRALRAALEIIAGLSALNATLGRPIHIRVGIHSGLVVIGEMGGEAKREQMAMGEVPNIAARLQAIAEPDSAVVSADTYHLARGFFEFSPMGFHELKGVARPLEVYRLLRDSDAPDRFDPGAASEFTPLVGRDDELSVLKSAWQHAKQGAGSVVIVVGEPGIGKSRLVRELETMAIGEAASWVHLRCSPYYQSTPLHPVVDRLQRLLGFVADESGESKLRKLEVALASLSFDLAQSIPLFCALLSLPLDGRYALPPLTPQKLREKIQQAVVEWMLKGAERSPLVLVGEDLQWADPSTLEFLSAAVDQASVYPLLIVLTARPEFTFPWLNREHVKLMTLRRLREEQSLALAQHALSGKLLPAGLGPQILAKTDGVPLLVEELMRTMLESGLLREIDTRYEFTGDISSLSIPPTLHGWLMARLDRLGEGKDVAQFASVLGREFGYDVLSAASPIDPSRLARGLEALVQGGLLQRRGFGEQARFQFKHALICDAAYESLLKTRRRQYHGRVAEVLEKRFPDTLRSSPELVANHFTRAGTVNRALPYWLKAGQDSVQRSANAEAISQLGTGLALLEQLSDTLDRANLELQFQMTLGVAWMGSRGYAAPEVGQAFSRAQELCSRLGESPQVFPVLIGLWTYHFVRGELRRARQLGEQCLSIAEAANDKGWLMEARTRLGIAMFYIGELAGARSNLAAAAALYDPEQHRSHALIFGTDPGAASRVYLGFALCLLGFPDSAVTEVESGIEIAQAVGHPLTVAFSINNLLHVRVYRCENDLILKAADELLRLSNEQGFPQYVALSNFARGKALSAMGRCEEGAELIRAGIDGWTGVGARVGLSYMMAALAEAQIRLGRFEEAEAALSQALRSVETNDEYYYGAELHRLKGELLVRSNRAPDEAEQSLRTAVETARAQGAGLFELRAAADLADLQRSIAPGAYGHEWLRESLNRFTEGFETPDVRRARALLEQLAPQGSARERTTV